MSKKHPANIEVLYTHDTRDTDVLHAAVAG
jgi:hypothetical protein